MTDQSNTTKALQERINRLTVDLVIDSCRGGAAMLLPLTPNAESHLQSFGLSKFLGMCLVSEAKAALISKLAQKDGLVVRILDAQQ